jgi:transcriptional regulator with XRE-family HTH domain
MAAAGFGAALREWRQRRRITQLDLAGAAEVSTRHLSWLETGRAHPSRAMVLRLAERLEVPPRERNRLLALAGFAPLYSAHRWEDPAMAAPRAALARLLEAHEPWPALAVDRHWNLLAANRAVAVLLQLVPPSVREAPLNVLRMSLHPQGLAPMIEGVRAWRDHVLQRLRRQMEATGDPVLVALHAELRELPVPASEATATPPPEDAVAIPLALRTPFGRLEFITTVTVFGAPHDVTLAEIAIETLLPADPTTAEALRRLQAAGWPAAPAVAPA